MSKTNSLSDPNFRGTFGTPIRADSEIQKLSDNAVTVIGTDLNTLYRECYNDIVAYINSHDRADYREVFNYIESFNVSRYVEAEYLGVNVIEPKYNPFFKEISDYKALTEMIRKLIAERLKLCDITDNISATTNEAVKKEALRLETKRYFYEFCTKQLIEDKTFVAYTADQLIAFTKNLAANIVPFNKEAAVVYEKLCREQPKQQSLMYSTLKWLQSFDANELAEHYRFCNGPQFSVIYDKDSETATAQPIVNGVLKVKVK
jgi:hypothetical protein